MFRVRVRVWLRDNNNNNNNLLIYSAPFSMEMIKGALHIQY